MPKDIVLLSDGTGNSSSKLFKSNVWRLYQTLDLTDPSRQVAMYDNGVGTSAFKPMAILGGAVGWGLKRNVQDLYAFLCRHYEDGDRVHLFGFSRGAFTVRVLSGLITRVGVVKRIAGVDVPIHEGHLKLAVADAYRAYRRRFNVTGGLVPALRWLRDRVIAGKRALCGEPQPDAFEVHEPRIEFIGVWDTVAAYGTPLEEMTRGIDYWIWPLSMPDRHLNEKVDRACHALAIDDERETFHPMLWTEEGTDDTQHSEALEDERISQVWFCGMHSDVGGGYPDDALALVPLDWMFKRIDAWTARRGHGIALLSQARTEAVASRSTQAPLHDSRKGVSGYYRYTPRSIETLCHRIVADHAKRRAQGKSSDQVLIARPKIHESVFARLRAGTGGYAPFTLPRRYALVHDDGRIENGRPETASQAAARHAGQQDVWNTVWKRRVTYFATVFASLWLLAFPLLFQHETACTGFLCVIVPPFEVARAFLPSVAGAWLDAFERRPGWFLIAGAVLAGLLYRGASLDQNIRDRMRPLWASVSPAYHSARPVAPGRFDAIIRAVRTSRGYRWVFRSWKEYVGPAVFGLVFVLAGAALIGGPVLVLAHRAAFWWADGKGEICRSEGTPEAVPDMIGATKGVSMPFKTTDRCFATGLSLEAERHYRITLTLSEPWFDRTIPTNPRGFGGERSTFPMKVFVPFNRSVTSRWFQPIAKIASDTNRRGVEIPLDFSPNLVAGSNVFEAVVQPRHGGELFLFVNDTVAPWCWWLFYENNTGTAQVAVERIEDPSKKPRTR